MRLELTKTLFVFTLIVVQGFGKEQNADSNKNPKRKEKSLKADSGNHANVKKHDAKEGLEKEDEWAQEIMKVAKGNEHKSLMKLEEIKPIPKMTKNQSKNVKEEDKQKGKKKVKAVLGRKSGGTRPATRATKTDVVDELEKRKPTESWLIKVTGSKKKHADKKDNRPTVPGNKKFGLTEPSTPTLSSAKPTTIKETFPTTKSNNLTGTPSHKLTTEAVSTPVPQNEFGVSGSGSTVITAAPTNTATQNHYHKMEEHTEPTKTTSSSVDTAQEVKPKSDNDEGGASNSLDENETKGGESEAEGAEQRTAKEEQKTILCIGDSITEGYYNHGNSFHPYTKKLLELLNAERNHVVYNVYNEGKSGECVDPAMINRMPSLLHKYKPINLVIIIGGTNDFNNNNCSDGNLFESIKTLHKMAHDADLKTVAVTIPDSNAPQLPGRSEKENVWESVNDKIRDFAKASDNVILCDLAEELPYRTLTDDERNKYWDDDLHYNPAGYDRMAEIIYDVIQGNF